MIVACVWCGDRYSLSYVLRLKKMVERYLSEDHDFVCLTDQPHLLKGRRGITALDVSSLRLKSWWNKMALFMPGWRSEDRVLYFDLDSVIVGSLLPLARLDVDFGICASFTRAAGITTWPCKYGSCVMTIAPTFGNDLWRRFIADSDRIMADAGKFGDQKAIEALEPNAALLQPLLPSSFFLGYRQLPAYTMGPPRNCAIVVFAGKHKPDNCTVEWVERAWAA